jgi:hypothetical protein
MAQHDWEAGIDDALDLPRMEASRQSMLAAAKLFPRTDSGNAELFAKLHGDQLRFDHRMKRWLKWSGSIWVPDRDGGVVRLAKQTARDRLTRIDLQEERAGLK